MSANILASTTQVLDLLVPLEGHDRARVLRAVQAAIDLTVEVGAPTSSQIMINGELTTIPGVVEIVFSEKESSKGPDRKQKEKPPTAAPKARNPNEKGALRLALFDQIPALIRQQGRPLRPVEILRLLSVPSRQVSTLSTALKDLLDAGKLCASGTTASRYYDVVSP